MEPMGRLAAKGDMLERAGWTGIVIDTDDYGHALLAFGPKVGSFPRQNEWVLVEDWNAVTSRRHTLQEQRGNLGQKATRS